MFESFLTGNSFSQLYQNEQKRKKKSFFRQKIFLFQIFIEFLLRKTRYSELKNKKNECWKT